MGLFKKREDSRVARIRCPKCGHSQVVEKGVLSVHCQRCATRITTAREADVATAIKPLAPARDSSSRKISVDCPACGSRNDVPPEALSVFCRKCQGIISLKKETSAIRGLDGKSNGGKMRTVTCYTCMNNQTVPVSALSAFCSNCGNRIDLKDRDITTEHREKIMTRGALHVLKSGKVHAEINVMSALIDGELHGNVFAEDKLKIGRGGKVYGNIIAARMEIEDGAFYSGNVRLNTDKIMNGGTTK